MTFAHYGERGVVDLLAWHADTRSLLIIELKTELVDPQGLVATMHQRVRLGREIAQPHGWEPATVSTWVIVRRSRTEQRRLVQHRAILRRAFPSDGRQARRWLRQPGGAIAALSMWTDVTPGGLSLGALWGARNGYGWVGGRRRERGTSSKARFARLRGRLAAKYCAYGRWGLHLAPFASLDTI